MAVILYLDLLGSRSRWREGGAAAAREAFDAFTGLVIAAAKPDLDAVIDGGIETDSAALVCSDAAAALRIARRAYVKALFRDHPDKNHRTWLRGAVVPSDDAPLRTSRPANGRASQLSIWIYSPSFFDAVAIEKSGFKGMRLLIHSSLMNTQLKNGSRIPIGSLFLMPIRRLRHSSYPKMKDGDVLEYLWMIGNDAAEWTNLQFQMAKRLREANSDPEEFAQAAATQVVFHEADALFRSLSHRAKVLATAKP